MSTINDIACNYSIEQFINDHGRNDFIDVLKYDFNNNPAFDSLKLLTKLL